MRPHPRPPASSETLGGLRSLTEHQAVPHHPREEQEDTSPGTAGESEVSAPESGDPQPVTCADAGCTRAGRQPARQLTARPTRRPVEQSDRPPPLEHLAEPRLTVPTGPPQPANEDPAVRHHGDVHAASATYAARAAGIALLTHAGQSR